MVDLKLMIFRRQIPNRNSEKTGIGRHEFRQACIGSKDGRNDTDSTAGFDTFRAL